MRLFVAVGLPEAVLDEAVRLRDSLEGMQAKLVARELMHATLHFIGDADDAGFFIEKLAKVRATQFRAQLTRLGVFSLEFVRVAWLGVEGLALLYDQVCKVLDVPPKLNFEAHITLARIMALRDKRAFLHQISLTSVNQISFDVHHFLLMSSELRPQGPEYKVLKEFKLPKSL